MADQEEVRGATSLASATEHLWRIYQVINEWIRFADAKSGALLAACGAIITIEVTVMSDHQDYLKAHHLIFVLAVAAVVGLIVSS
ncbi:MAG TPA: hypothetical protein VG406_28710, partial [Isosphaeraceae bacterium]|nr:hypothetical protein [Isosphaeraceae bacterium]